MYIQVILMVILTPHVSLLARKLTSTSERLNKQICRAQEDSDQLRTELYKMQTSLDMGVKKNKEHMDSETRRLEPLGC